MHLIGKFIGLVFLISLLAFCRKKETLEVDNETQSVVDNAVAEQEFMIIAPACQQHALNTKGTGAQGKMLASCDSLTKISGDTSWTQSGHVHPVYQLNVSNSTCALTMPDGKVRSGTLNIKLTDKLRNPGAKMVIRLINYKAANLDFSADSIVVTTITSNSLVSTFNVKIVNGVVKQGNSTIKYNSERTVTNYFYGNPSGTSPYSVIYGSTSGVNRQGKAFSANIPSSTPLVKAGNCQFISKGVFELTPEGFKQRQVDYGNGTCDDDATFTVNGNTIAFKLK